MLFKKSKYVLVTVHAKADGELAAGPAPSGETEQRLRFTRPDCDTQLEWASRLADVMPAGGKLSLQKDELRQMREDLARYLDQVDGEPAQFTAAELGELLSPSDVFGVWALLLNECRLQESDRGKSRRQSTSPSTSEAATTAAPAPTRRNGRAAAPTI